MALPLQTWLAGSTASDLLIAAAMLYHVDCFASRKMGSPDADYLTPIL
jgi:hypothetical protein